MNSYQKQKLRKAILKNMIILVDSREQNYQHIINYLNDNQISHEHRKLDFGDYSFKLGKFTLESYVAIERKNSIDELIQNSIEKDKKNLTNNNINRIERELLRAKESGAYLEIMVEDDSWKTIFGNAYSNMMTVNAVIGKLNKYKFIYNCNIQFVEWENAGQYILSTCLGWAMNNLIYKNNVVFREELLKYLGVIR
jgi:ERCC4-type nuclease